MYDLQKVGKLVADIEKYLKELEGYKVTKEGLKDSKTYHASSMLIFAILNRLIDLCGEIISAEELGAPNAYQDIMNILAKGNIINKEQAEKISNLVSKRNIFAHVKVANIECNFEHPKVPRQNQEGLFGFYGDITEKEVLDTVNDLSVVHDFLKTIKKRVKIY